MSRTLEAAGFLEKVFAEFNRAREKFPEPNPNFTALVEEVGEVARLFLSVQSYDSRRALLREECVQVAAMAMRIALEDAYDDANVPPRPPSRPLEDIDLDEELAKLKAKGSPLSEQAGRVMEAIGIAKQCVADLCSGKQQWNMRIPADPDKDPDLIISAALNLASHFVRQWHDYPEAPPP